MRLFSHVHFPLPLLVRHFRPINSPVDSSSKRGKTVTTMGCLVRDNNDNNDANALHSLRPFQREKRKKKSKVRGVSERIEGGEGKGKRSRECGQRWKTCQLSYSSPEFFVRTVCQNEEGNIISIPPPVTPRPFSSSSAHSLPPPPFFPRPIVLFLVNREFEL